MKNGFHYDGVLKDLFQRDHPSLLDQLTGGVGVKEFLNVELPKVLERRLDLVVRLADGTILHIEFQSYNDRDMPYRDGVYCFLLGQKYRVRIRQVVLYVGQAKMRMADGVDLGETKGAYRLIDICAIDARVLLRRGRPGDCALALLAGGGVELLREIASRAATLKGPRRARLLAQLTLLSGLRGVSGRLKMELKKMGMRIDISKNEILRDIFHEAMVESRAEGRAEGRTEGKAQLLRRQLEKKFGRLPKWAGERLTQAIASDVERWALKVMTADTLEGVLGKKPGGATRASLPASQTQR